MVTNLAWGLNKARIWQGELPAIMAPVTEVLRTAVPARHSGSTQPRMAAVELSQPVGPRVLYGLLGATFTPAEGETLEIAVATSDFRGVPVPWALVAPIEEARAGLWAAYGPSVLEAAAAHPDLSRLGAGVLQFTCAAHGQVGSSPAIFRQLAQAVIKTLIRQHARPTVEDLFGPIHRA